VEAAFWILDHAKEVASIRQDELKRFYRRRGVLASPLLNEGAD
jgi:hypothetical protein